MSKLDNPQILEVMKDNHLCVLSTLGLDGSPQSALVGFAEDENGRLVIGTSNKSRKFGNIGRDGRVAVVIGGWEVGKTIQYEGVAHEAQGEEWTQCQALQVAKHPSNQRFRDLPDETYIAIEPTWIRLTDAKELPWKITEWRA